MPEPPSRTREAGRHPAEKKMRMNVSKLGLALCLSATTIALTGCFDDKPSDKVAAETIRKYADNDLAEGLEIANFQRANGQVDPGSANRYKVTYSYDLRLAKPYAEVVLANAKALQSDWTSSAKRETGNFFDATKLQNGVQDMQIKMAVDQWIQNQDGGFAARRDAFLGPCAPCVDYWNSPDAPKEATLRRRAFIASWSYFEELGFKDTAKPGEGVPRNAWAFFSKTEKGWQPAN